VLLKTKFQSLGVSRQCHWKIHGFCLHYKLPNKLQRFYWRQSQNCRLCRSPSCFAWLCLVVTFYLSVLQYYFDSHEI